MTTTTKTRDRRLSQNSITIYVDTEKRQSVAISSGLGYNTVEKLVKKINSNPASYQHQTCAILHIYWTSYVWYIVLIIFMIVLLLTFFFAFFPDQWLKIWRRDIWFYLCIALGSFIIISVIIYYIIQCCDKNRWLDNELQRIHVLIRQSNTIEYSDKHNYKKKSKNWVDYTDSESDYDENNINNLHYVNLNPVTLTKKEKDEDVVKMKIEIWLENKPKRDRIIKKMVSKIDETESKDEEFEINHDSDIEITTFDPINEADLEREGLIHHNDSHTDDVHIPIERVSNEQNEQNENDGLLVDEMKDEKEIQHILPKDQSESD